MHLLRFSLVLRKVETKCGRETAFWQLRVFNNFLLPSKKYLDFYSPDLVTVTKQPRGALVQIVEKLPTNIFTSDLLALSFS